MYQCNVVNQLVEVIIDAFTPEADDEGCSAVCLDVGRRLADAGNKGVVLLCLWRRRSREINFFSSSKTTVPGRRDTRR